MFLADTSLKSTSLRTGTAWFLLSCTSTYLEPIPPILPVAGDIQDLLLLRFPLGEASLKAKSWRCLAKQTPNHHAECRYISQYALRVGHRTVCGGGCSTTSANHAQSPAGHAPSAHAELCAVPRICIPLPRSLSLRSVLPHGNQSVRSFPV